MDWFSPAFERTVARLTGPMNARFIVQPIIATALGIRDGLHDARAEQPPFLSDLYTHPDRKELFKKALHRLMIPLIVAIALDIVVQFMLFQRVRFLGAVAIGAVIMGLPYSLAREIANRIASAHQSSVVPNPSERRLTATAKK